MKATRKDHVIIKCARRLIDKLDSHRFYIVSLVLLMFGIMWVILMMMSGVVCTVK